MRLYRVAWVAADWETLTGSDPFHPLYVAVDRQGQGRFDNPDLYAALYAATTPEGAVGESLGNYSRWPAEEIEREKSGWPRCLVSFEVPESTNLLDLDDAAVLLDLNLRPTDVVRRDRGHTQAVASAIWRERSETGVRGLKWWSYWRPEWTTVVIWSVGVDAASYPDVNVTGVEPLQIGSPAVRSAAEQLPRELGP